MEKQTQITAAYAPQPGDFEFLPERDIMTDRNFASLSYWKGVLLHFLKDRKAMTGLIIIIAIINMNFV